jgi:predicted RNase H-like nuclease
MAKSGRGFFRIMRRSGFKRRNKYGAIKTLKDGVVFDSKLEAHHYEQLKLLQAAGEIKDLDLQHELRLAFNNIVICTYIADYYYYDCKAQKWVISDAKGIETPVFKLKWKMVKALYPEFILEKRKKWKVIRE